VRQAGQHRDSGANEETRAHFEAIGGSYEGTQEVLEKNDWRAAILRWPFIAQTTSLIYILNLSLANASSLCVGRRNRVILWAAAMLSLQQRGQSTTRSHLVTQALIWEPEEHFGLAIPDKI
jgi:hypothetical protein